MTTHTHTNITTSVIFAIPVVLLFLITNWAIGIKHNAHLMDSDRELRELKDQHFQEHLADKEQLHQRRLGLENIIPMPTPIIEIWKGLPE